MGHINFKSAITGLFLNLTQPNYFVHYHVLCSINLVNCVCACVVWQLGDT